MHAFRVSVIIPVYNAAPYLEEAVQSALEQPETAEVVLIEDGSTDDSWRICQKLSASDTRVKLYTHPGHENRGAGPSRNLGIQKATSEFLAFLDADDIFLPSRFAVTGEVFRSNPDADGVHETIGTQYASASLRTRHLERVRTEFTGLMKEVKPEQLFSLLATGKQGHIHLNGLVIRKQALDDSLLFDASLRQCQDSDWILRIANSRRLYVGKPGHPVAMRRVHAENRVLKTPEAIRFQQQYLLKCIQQDFYGSVDRHAKLYIVARYVSWLWNGRLRRLGILSRIIIIQATGIYLISHPRILYRIIAQ